VSRDYIRCASIGNTPLWPPSFTALATPPTRMPASATVAQPNIGSVAEGKQEDPASDRSGRESRSGAGDAEVEADDLGLLCDGGRRGFVLNEAGWIEFSAGVGGFGTGQAKSRETPGAAVADPLALNRSRRASAVDGPTRRRYGLRPHGEWQPRSARPIICSCPPRTWWRTTPSEPRPAGRWRRPPPRGRAIQRCPPRRLDKGHGYRKKFEKMCGKPFDGHYGLPYLAIGQREIT